MAWENSHSHGFPRWMRAAILRQHPTCRCTGCPHCNDGCTRSSTEADHIVPVAQGGPSHTTNGQGMCTPCHQHKSSSEGGHASAAARPKRQRPTDPHPGLL